VKLTLPRSRPLSKKVIDACFADARDQGDYILALYRLAIGKEEFEACAMVDGFPTVSMDTGAYIAERAHAYDKEHHPDVVPGGNWILNVGFGRREGRRNWRVYLDEVKLA